jgi:hypothetical protein
MMKLIKVILFSFLILTSILRFSVAAQTINTGVVGEPVAAESFDNGIIVFSTSEFSVGFDLNGDGDELDYVIRYYNVSSGVTTNTTAVGENPAIGDNIIAFTTYEGYIGEDLNNDTETDDYILRYYDIVSGITENTGEFGLEPVVDNGVIVFFVAEDWLDEDLNGDGNKVDRFIWYYNVSSGVTFNATTISGTYASKRGDIIAFETRESWDNIDLNGDGDMLDSVIRYYNMSTGIITNTTAVGYEPSFDGNIIAFYTEEFDVGDLNGDGDTSDRIIRYYNISSGTITNTTVYGTFPCVEGDIIAFETWEPDFGEDVNGDGDTDDNVIRYYNILSGVVATTAEMGFYASVDGRKIAFGTYESHLGQDVNGDGDQNDVIIRYCATIFQGDLILTDNDVYTIEGRFDINGSIMVTENATLILKNAVINFTQIANYQFNMSLRNPVNGNPRLQSENSTITSDYWFQVILYGNSSATFVDSTDTSYLAVYDSATASVSNSTIKLLFAAGSPVVSLFNSTISYGMVVVGGSPDVSVSNSTIESLTIQAVSVNCTFADIVPGSFAYWNSILNSSMVIAAEGYAPNVTLMNTNINGWQLDFEGSTNATIIDSQLRHLFSYEYSNVWLINSTASLFFFMKGKVYVLWYADVHVIDSIGNDVPSANLTATYPNTTLAESVLTDVSGWARLTLMEKMMNATGEYPVGNYTLTATYETYSNQTEVNMTGNQVVTLRLEDFVVPEFSSILILPMLITTALLAFVIRRRKPAHKTKTSTITKSGLIALFSFL